MAAPSVLFLNGPNANLYGLDAKGTYGTESFPEIEARCRKHAGALGLDLDFRQSNHEGVLIDWIQDARQNARRAHHQWRRLDLYLDRHPRCVAGLREADPGSAHEQYLPARAIPASFLHLEGGDRHRRRPGPDGLRARNHRHVASARRRRGCMKRDALIFYSAFDDADAWNRTLTAELPDLEFRTDPAVGDPDDGPLRAGLETAGGVLRQISKSGAGDQPGRRRRLAGRPRRSARCPDLAPVGYRHGVVDDQLCTVRGHALCARYPDLRARPATQANGNTFIRARSRTIRVGVLGLGELGRAPRRRPWPASGSTCAAGAGPPRRSHGVDVQVRPRCARRFPGRNRNPRRDAAVDAGYARPARRAAARTAAARRRSSSMRRAAPSSTRRR